MAAKKPESELDRLTRDQAKDLRRAARHTVDEERPIDRKRRKKEERSWKDRRAEVDFDGLVDPIN